MVFEYVVYWQCDLHDIEGGCRSDKREHADILVKFALRY